MTKIFAKFSMLFALAMLALLSYYYLIAPNISTISISNSASYYAEHIYTVEEFNNLQSITIDDAFKLLKNAIPTDHWLKPCHHKECNPDKIKEIILKAGCNPIEVYFCAEYDARQRIKFICPTEPGSNIYYGLSLGVNPSPTYSNLPFEITAFPSTMEYWRTSVASCTFIGMIVHP